MSLAQIISLVTLALSKAPDLIDIIEQAASGKLTYDEAVKRIQAAETASAAVDAKADADAKQAIEELYK